MTMIPSFDWKLDLGNRGVLTPGRWLWVRATAWGLVLFGVALAGFIASIALASWLKLPVAFSRLFAGVLPVLTTLIYAAAVRRFEKRAVTEFAIGNAPLELAIGGLLGFGFIAAILLLLWSLGLYQVHAGHWKRWYDFFLFNSYISGVLEELAFRAILLRIFARMIGPVGGLVISAALFGAAHAGHAPLVASLQIALNSGLVTGLLYMVSGRLWLAIGLHIGLDFTEWSLLGVGDKSGLLAISPVPGHSALLTGGAFGPDGSILANVVALPMILGILAYIAWRSERPAPARAAA
ncbi:type II CAAX endopeptidase family protein [Phenylobacterium sp.]|uniref:CPBP family intramembrane glutamic endopeptidase n=1 Tax=Phenylobacterium sp. TaxID=1871053 RepID=UPI00120CC776|nr:type II CAAX endopeptidase family protein [Phenylobacterium sp.]THD51222.1 MAG: CPBP family intramembrane metalloprotease [Phenylobacterium sp.]